MRIKATTLRTLAGAIPGTALATLGGIQMIKSRLGADIDIKSDLVNAQEMVDKHAPGVLVASTKRDLKKVPDITPKQRKALEGLLDFAKRSGNAAYIRNRATIVSPKMVNRSMIGHEIGHSIDIPKRDPSTIDNLLRSRVEEAAWDASPFKDEKALAARKRMLGTYKGGDKVILGGTIAGTGAAAMMALPSLMKLLKK